MSYLVLARKWRPQNFDQVLGQDATVKTLKNAILKQRVAHAFLFTGPRGVGKTSLARILAKSLNCMSSDGPTVSPCGECAACREITEGSSVDVIEIDGASNRGIDNIRELRETVRYLPSSYRTKIYIIDEVHMLTTDAFNALLKTLEEPPSHVAFIFATTEAHKVPATILSRCQRYDFHRVGAGILAEHLGRICEAERVSLPESALRVIAREAEGGVRDALSLLDQLLSFGAETLTEEEIFSILGVMDHRLVLGLARSVFAGDAASCLEFIRQADEAGHDIKQLSRELLIMFRNLMVIKVARDPLRLLDLTEQEGAALSELSAPHSLETLDRMFEHLVRMDERLSRVSQPRLLMEVTVVKMASTPAVAPLVDLLARLDELEKSLALGESAPVAESENIPPLFNPRRESDPAEPSCPAPEEAGWEDFMGMVENKDHKLFALLTHGTFTGRTGKDWRLTFPPGNWVLERLKGKDNSSRIKELMNQALGEGHRLILSEDDSVNKPAPSKTNRYEQESERRKKAMDDPVVQVLLDNLGGEIEEVKVK